MLFESVVIGVPLLVYVLVPKIIGASKAWRWLLFVACVVMSLSWFLPSPLVDGRETQFMTHFVGGGVFTGLLWLYIKLVKQWRASWWVEAASLFALVSALGVVNELFEIVLYVTGGMQQLGDTSWDLLANTLGAAFFYVVYVCGVAVTKKRR